MLEASHDSHGVGIARKLIRSLPASSRLMQNKERVVEGIGPNSLDADLADLLLHPQDQSYTVSGIVEWLDEASLEAIEFEPPGSLCFISSRFITSLSSQFMSSDLLVPCSTIRYIPINARPSYFTQGPNYE